ncbi:chondroadherin [Hydra vulgaris]|uniref:Chondroadherin n=1 Tax=Hydra vulgaris TaxID=6087 RepID=A0ABM4CSY6_HYDVU
MKRYVFTWLLCYFSLSKGFSKSSCRLEQNKAYCLDELNSEDLMLLHQILPNSIGELFISFQNMQSFQTCNFKNFTNLTVLSLTYNQMIDLPQNISTCLPSVKRLLLNNNKFKSISKQSFTSYRNIEVLRLHRNELQKIPPKTFQTMERLQELWLNGNSFTTIESKSFYGLDKLETLNLANCELKEINDNLFSKLKFLRSLNLEYNNINFVGKHAFQNIKMQYIDLSSNNISTLYGETFCGSTLTQLNLANNPIDCSCEALSALRFSLNILGKCSSPEALKGGELNKTFRNIESCNSNTFCHEEVNRKYPWVVLWIAMATICCFIVLTGIYCCCQKRILRRKQKFIIFANTNFDDFRN